MGKLKATVRSPPIVLRQSCYHVFIYFGFNSLFLLLGGSMLVWVCLFVLFFISYRGLKFSVFEMER